MQKIYTSLNEAEYKHFKSQCDQLNESEYAFVKKAVFERMIRNGSVIARIQKWLLTDHPSKNPRENGKAETVNHRDQR